MTDALNIQEDSRLQLIPISEPKRIEEVVRSDARSNVFR